MAAEVVVPSLITLHGYDGETSIENNPPGIYQEAWMDQFRIQGTSNELTYRTTSPIVGIKDYPKKTITRPKSVPLLRNRQVVNGKARPKTATVHSFKECDRLGQVERESTRKHNFENHLPPRRQRTTPWQKQLEASTVPIMVTPSYILSKSKSKIEMTINPEEFFEPQPPPIPRMREDPERDSLISQLQQQIDDITLFLEEERLNHRETKRKTADLMQDKLEEITYKHEKTIRQIQNQHEEEIQHLKASYEETLKSSTEKSNETIDKLNKDIEYLQAAFESYKSNLHFEMDERWKKKEDELIKSHEEQFNERVSKIKHQWQLERNAEKNQSDKNHKGEILTLKRDQKREIDALLRKYSDHQGDLDKLKTATEELQYSQQKLSSVQESYDRVCTQLTTVTLDLTDTKVKLNGYEEHFQEKIQDIHDKYKSQINELKQANIELRRLFVKKCEELFDEKAISEHAIQHQLGSAKETMKRRDQLFDAPNKCEETS